MGPRGFGGLCLALLCSGAGRGVGKREREQREQREQWEQREQREQREQWEQREQREQWERHRGDPAGDTGPPGATRTPQRGHRGRGRGDNVAEGHLEPSWEPRGPRGDAGGEPEPNLLGCPSPVLVPRHLRGAGPARALCHLPEEKGQRDRGPGHERQRLLRSGGSGPAPRPRPHPKNPGGDRDPLGPGRAPPAPAGLAPRRLLRVPGWPQ